MTAYVNFVLQVMNTSKLKKRCICLRNSPEIKGSTVDDRTEWD